MAEPVLENSSSRSAYPRDPPKNDVALFRSAATDNLEKQRFCVVNHHNRGFERSELMHNEDNDAQNYRKTQHFIRGKMAGESNKNTFVYGEHVFTDNLERRKGENQAEGFLYGSSAIKRLEKKIPARRPNNKLLLEEKMIDNQVGKHQKLAADTDNYLARYYEKKAREQSEISNEKKKDLEMLRDYNPWGKPGGGAPRGYRNNEVDANLTKQVEKLKQEDRRHKRVGGGGSPNRTDSGTVRTSLKMDPELRFRAVQYNSDIDPRLRYRPNVDYGKELDALVQDTIKRKTSERRKNLEEEIRQVKSNPFTEDRAAVRFQKNDPNETKPLSNEDVYDPWGKGIGGIRERKENGKIVKNLQGFKQDIMEKPWLIYGSSENDFSVHNKGPGNVNSRKKATLSKNTYGQAFVRDFSSKGTAYNPWGRPGAGAPLKDQCGHVVTNTIGRLAHDNTEGSAELKKDPVRKKEYLKTLEKQRHDIEILRQQDKTNYSKPDDIDVANWVRQGKVGRPVYDAVTKQICANPKATSDITREKFQIRSLKNNNSKCYYDDLQEMADERHKRRQMEKTKEQQLSFNHVETMNSFWGRPGGGAPVMRDQPRRHHAEELLPMNSTIFR